MKYKSLFYTLLLLILYTGCSTSRLRIEKPSENYIEPEIEVKNSTVGMTLDIDLRNLEKSVNTLLTGVIYEDNNMADDNLMLKVTKVQDIRFTALGNKISCSIPLKLAVQAGFKTTVLGIPVEQKYHANGAITINLNTIFDLQKDWKLLTATSLLNYTWTERPTINVAGLTLPVTAIADIAISALSKKINNSIDEAIAANLDIKRIMDDAWKMTQEPICLNETYDAWIRITPQTIFSTPIANKGGHLYIDLGMNAIIGSTVGKKPPVISKTEMPQYQQVPRIKPDVNLNISVDVDYQKLKEIAAKQIVGKVFSQGNKTVTITKIDFYGHEGSLVVAVHVKGSADGVIYCVGKPIFNNQTHKLQITDFEFDVKTKNALANTANWLLHKKFITLIEPYLTISLKEEIKEILKTGNETLDNFQLAIGVSLKGSVHDVILNSITISPKSLLINGTVTGNLKLSVRELEFN